MLEKVLDILLANLLVKYHPLEGNYVRLRTVTSEKVVLLAHKLGVSDGCSDVSEDMSKEFSPTDVYKKKNDR